MFEVVDDVGVCPDLGSDELAAEDAVAVDDVGFGDLDGAVEGVDALVAVADGDEIDVVFGEEATVDGVVLIGADADDGDLGESVLEIEEAGQFFDAGCAPGGPEIEDDDFSVKAGEVEPLDAVTDGEERCGFFEALRVVAAVAAGGEREGQTQSGGEDGMGSA